MDVLLCKCEGNIHHCIKSTNNETAASKALFEDLFMPQVSPFTCNSKDCLF